MANLNSVILIGRCCREPEARTFGSGGKVVKFGFVNNSRRKNKTTGEWEDEPMFIDVEAWNRGEFGKTADFIEQHVKKGSNVAIRGEVRLDQWDDKASGQKRSKHKIVCDSLQLLDKKQDSGPSDSDVQASDPGQPTADGGEIPF